jgi:acyl-coenzyme A thioesterase PaaI-like protein
MSEQQPVELVQNLYLDHEAPDEVVAGRRLATAVRRLIAATSGPDLDVHVLEEAAEEVEALADRLGPSRLTTRWPGTGEDPAADAADRRCFEWHPLIGPSNPLASPLRIERHGDRAVGVVSFNQAYEGPRGAVHGGVIAAMFDVMLISAAAISKVAGVTGTLSIKYLKPTPLWTELRYESWLEDTTERKAMVKGRALADGQVVAEAEGVFIRFAAPPSAAS